MGFSPLVGVAQMIQSVKMGLQAIGEGLEGFGTVMIFAAAALGTLAAFTGFGVGILGTIGAATGISGLLGASVGAVPIAITLGLVGLGIKMIGHMLPNPPEALKNAGNGLNRVFGWADKKAPAPAYA